MLEKRRFIRYNEAMARQIDMAEMTLVSYLLQKGGGCR